MGRKKRSPKMELFRSSFGASSVTDKNIDRGITSIKRKNINERRVIRREVGRQTEDARKKGNKQSVKRGEKVLRETTSEKVKRMKRKRKRKK
jgi:hypothetical protein